MLSNELWYFQIMIILIIVVILLVVIAIWLVTVYNRMVRLAVSCDEGASEIEVQLKRRYDLIPNLIETVKGYASHEKSVFTEVTEMRAAAEKTSGVGPAAAKAQGDLSKALVNLMAVSENYPDLKASTNFLALQDELTATEDRLSAARRFYNSTVKAANSAVRSIPSKWVAPMAGLSGREFFEVEDDIQKEAPKVSF